MSIRAIEQMNYLRSILYFVFWCLCNTLAAQEEVPVNPPWIEARGYIKDLQSVSFADSINSLSSVNLFHNRLNFKFNIAKNLTGRVEFRNRIFYGDQVKQIPAFGDIINQYNGWLNLSKLWVNERALVVHSVIDRVLLQYSGDRWDIRVGRQRINWGINNIWNPNDIFNAYNFLDFDYEERPGNDAIRIQHFFKNNSTLEAAFRPGKQAGEHTAAVLYKFNKKRYDFQFLAGLDQADLVVGAGWAGNIKNAGFKGEMSYFLPVGNTADSTANFAMSLMVDQTLANNWYLSAAALFNSQPSGTATGSGSIFSSQLSAKNLFPYRYSFYAGVVKSVSPITSVSLSVIFSPEKSSLILFPSFAWSIAKNFDLDITAQSFFAREGGGYRALGNAVYLRSKWSF